jgi:hypothetical protein
MTARIIKFPTRAVFVSKAPEGGWYVTVRSHSWLDGDRRSAITDARWLARNDGLDVREVWP